MSGNGTRNDRFAGAAASHPSCGTAHGSVRQVKVMLDKLIRLYVAGYTIPNILNAQVLTQVEARSSRSSAPSRRGQPCRRSSC